MAKTEIHPTPANPGFEVEITSGGRAYDNGQTSGVVRTLSPARAAAKVQARKRNFLIIGSCAALFAAIILWAWLSNPNTLVPSDAVARVNGEYIFERDIDREMDLTRAMKESGKIKDPTPPAAASVLESLITRLIQVQDARKARVVVSQADIDASLASIPKQINMTQKQFVALLAKYNRTLDDMRLSVSDALLINRHIDRDIAATGTTDDEKRTLTNDWQTQVAQAAKIDRLKPAGSGPAPRIGAEAPDFTLTDMSGKEVKLSSLRGRPVMLNFWATWCPPCRSEIPTIVDLYKNTHRGNNYEILGIAFQSENQTIQAFTQEFGMGFPIFSDVDSRTTSLYHVLPIPTTFFIDKDGIIRDMHIGIVDEATMKNWLLPQ